MACLNNIASFRCKACGHLEDSGAAGENAVPHACSVCGAGVIERPRLKALMDEMANPETTPERRQAIAKESIRMGAETKQLDPSNWEVLVECSEKRLRELGLSKKDICKHEPTVKTEPKLGRNIDVAAQG